EVKTRLTCYERSAIGFDLGATSLRERKGRGCPSLLRQNRSQPEYALMRAILLAVTGLDPRPWEERMRALAPQRDIRLWPQRLGDPADIAYACAWHAPRGLFARLPRLQAIFSLGAGVDHVFADPELPDVPVVRIVDPDLTMRMTEYVVLHVL